MSDATGQETPAEPIVVAPAETEAPVETVEVAPDEAPAVAEEAIDQVADDTDGIDDSEPSQDGDV